MFEYRQVIVRMRDGEGDRAIARAGLVARGTAKEIRRVAGELGWLDPASPIPEDATLARILGRKPGPVVASSVEAHREQVTKWARDGVQASTIFQALRRCHDYTGHYSSVLRFVRSVSPAEVEATVMLDFEPGEAAQVDFGAGPLLTDAFSKETVKTWFFVMTLAWSRHQYAEFVTDQSVATWLGCHRRAFAFFGGVTAKVTIDNPKCAITKACYHDPEVQRSYAALAEGYGFKVNPCPPRDPKKKGRVESGVKYIKRSFLPLRTFRSLADANSQLRDWILGEAGNRLHGSTHERPLTRFADSERPLLKALPDILPELAVWATAKVHGNCHVAFEKCRYSAPFRFVNREVWVRATDTTVRLYLDYELIATHPRLMKPGAKSTVDDHMPPEALAFKLRDPQWCLKRSEEVGPQCHQLVGRLFADRVLDNLTAAQGVMRLGDKYGPTRLEAACRRALAFDDPRYRTVKMILSRGLDVVISAAGESDDLPDIYTGSGRYQRVTGSATTH